MVRTPRLTWGPVSKPGLPAIGLNCDGVAKICGGLWQVHEGPSGRMVASSTSPTSRFREGESMATRMTRMATALVAATGLIALVLSGCSSTGAGKRASRDDEALRARTTGGTAIVNRFNLDSWSAPNDHTVILRTRD